MENKEQGYVFAPYILTNHTEESLNQYDIFMENYHKQHEVCPKCGSKEHTTTLMGYPLNLDDAENYRDENDCECLQCGDIHITHDRISIEEFNKQEKKT